MPHRFGATDIPLAPSGDGVDARRGEDVLVRHLLLFLRAMANAHAVAEWTRVAPGPPIASLADHPPQKFVFTTKSLPLLCLYRPGESEWSRIAADITVQRTVLALEYVPWQVSEEKHRVREHFADKLFKAWAHYLARGRDPAWYLPGDGYGGASTMVRVEASGLDPPGVTLAGAPRDGGARLQLAITVPGPLGVARFRFSIDGKTWVEDVPTAPEVVLTDTGLTARFAPGPYEVGHAFRSEAYTRGSVLAHHARFRRIALSRAVARPLTLKTRAESEPLVFVSYAAQLHVEEELVRDNTADFAPANAAGAFALVLSPLPRP